MDGVRAGGKGGTFLNTANKLTLTRIIMIPLFLVVLYLEFPFNQYIALAVFVLASVTDFVDGYIARHYDQVTDFGKFMDPLADKLLVCAAMICLVEMGRIPSWIVIIIISREFIISGFRLVASDKGVVIAANFWGKLKTTFQMVMICLMIANIGPIRLLTDIVMWAALGLTVISLVDYVVKNKEVMKDNG